MIILIIEIKKKLMNGLKKIHLITMSKNYLKIIKNFLRLKKKSISKILLKLKGHLILQKKVDFQRNIKMIILEILLRVLKIL